MSEPSRKKRHTNMPHPCKHCGGHVPRRELDVECSVTACGSRCAGACCSCIEELYHKTCEECEIQFFADEKRTCDEDGCLACSELLCTACFPRRHQKCPYCHLTVGDTLRRCGVCGMQSRRHCFWKKCGNATVCPRHADICDGCGTTLCVDCRSEKGTHCPDCLLKLREILDETVAPVLPTVLIDIMLSYVLSAYIPMW
jgi:hypothetical protein